MLMRSQQPEVQTIEVSVRARRSELLAVLACRAVTAVACSSHKHHTSFHSHSRTHGTVSKRRLLTFDRRCTAACVLLPATDRSCVCQHKHRAHP